MDHFPGKEHGHKLSDELENPFTVHVYLKASDSAIDKFHEWGWTPNVITTFGLIFGLLAIWFVIKGWPKLAGLTFLFSYFFDCADGATARKFDQATTWGSAYDHMRDLLCTVGLIVAIMIYYPMNYFWIGLLVAAFVLMAIHMGNVEEHNATCMQQEPCADATMRFCRYFSSAFHPRRDNDQMNNVEDDEELTGDRKFCANLFKQMRMTRWGGDVSVVLLLGFYLLTR